MKKIQTGKPLLIKGALRYFWEELKTMNRKKVKALISMIRGYTIMKLSGRIKGKRKSLSVNDR